MVRLQALGFRERESAWREKAVVAAGGGEVFEDVLWVEEFGVNVFGREEVTADDENLGGDVTINRKTNEQAHV